MVDNLDVILAIWDEVITKFHPTMVDDWDVILAIWDKLITKFHPTMVDEWYIVMCQDLNFTNDYDTLVCNFSNNIFNLKTVETRVKLYNHWQLITTLWLSKVQIEAFKNVNQNPVSMFSIYIGGGGGTVVRWGDFH